MSAPGGVRLTTLGFVRRSDETLMLRRPASAGLVKGRWNGLGGKLEPGESPEDCLRREVAEEAGLEVVKAELKGVITFPSDGPGPDVYTFVYLITEFAGAPRSSPEGDLFWVKTARLPELALWEGDRDFLPWLDATGHFSAKFRYVGGRYLGHEVDHYG